MDGWMRWMNIARSLLTRNLARHSRVFDFSPHQSWFSFFGLKKVQSVSHTQLSPPPLEAERRYVPTSITEIGTPAAEIVMYYLICNSS